MKGIEAAIVLASAMAIASPGGEVKMNNEGMNKAVAGLVEAMYNQDVNKADEIFHPACVHHVNGSEERLKGPEAIKQSIRQLREGFDSFRTTIDALLAENDLVAFRWTWTAKMKGSGQDYTLHGNTIFQFTGSKVSESWAIDDRLREMLRLGYTLTPPLPGK